MLTSHPDNDGFDAFVTPDGIHRKLNLAAPKMRMLSAMGRVQDVVELVPRSEWRPTKRLINIGDRIPRYDQGRVGRCEATSEVECMGILRAIAGLPVVRLSAPFAYAMVNGGVDAGVGIGDCYPKLSTTGVCREESASLGFLVLSQLTAAQYAEASKYVAVSAYFCNSIEEAFTAHYHGCVIAHGVVVGDQFNHLNAEGCTPNQPGMPNHAVTALDIVQLKSGQFGWLDLNHWTRQWGVDGNFIDPENNYRLMGYQACIAYQAVAIDPDLVSGDGSDDELPPAAPVLAGRTGLPLNVNQPSQPLGGPSIARRVNGLTTAAFEAHARRFVGPDGRRSYHYRHAC